MWYVGAILAILGSVCSNLGVNTQKFSFMKNAKLGAKAKANYTRQPLWVFGLLLVIAGSLGDFAALAFAAQSIVAPIGSTTLVANLFFAHLWLHEKLSRRDLMGTFMIIGGSTLAVAFGDHASQTYTINELKELYRGTLFLIYGSVLVILGSICYFIAKKLEPKKKRLVAAIIRYDEAFHKGDEGEIIAQDAIIADLEAEYQPYEKVHPFSYCALSGMLGANSILFGKMVAVLISTTFQGSNQMTNYLTYIFLLCMFATIFSQLHFLALALQHFDALYVVPVFQCFFITVSTVGGACFFLEFSNFQTIQIIMFPVGIFITLSGVYLLSARKMKSGINRMNEEERIAHCIRKKEELREKERSESIETEEGGSCPDDAAKGIIKRQPSTDPPSPLHITVDVAHRHSLNITPHTQRDSVGQEITMNPLHSGSNRKYQVPPIVGLKNGYLTATTTSSQSRHVVHGAVVPNAVGHGVLMVVGADHVDEVTPNVKDEITMNDGTVVVVTSRYARKSLNRTPNSTDDSSCHHSPRQSVVHAHTQSHRGSPIPSRHASPVHSPPGSQPASPKSRARSIYAAFHTFQTAFETAIIGSTPLHSQDYELPPPLPAAYLAAHGLHVAQPHTHSQSIALPQAVVTALTNHTNTSHTIHVPASTKSTPRNSVHINVAPIVAHRSSLSKPRFSLTKATSILPNHTTPYQAIPLDDTPRVDIMPSMAEEQTPKMKSHTVTLSIDDSNSGNSYMQLPSPSQSINASPTTQDALIPPSLSKTYSLSETPSSTHPLIRSNSDDNFSSSTMDFPTQQSTCDPPSMVSPGLSYILANRTMSDADAIPPNTSLLTKKETSITPPSTAPTTTTMTTTTTTPSRPHTRHQHTRSQTSLLSQAAMEHDDSMDMEISSQERRISLEPHEKLALSRAEMILQTTTNMNTNMNTRGRPTSMGGHMTTTTIPTETRATSTSVVNPRPIPKLSPIQPTRVRLNLHGGHSDVAPAPTNTTALAVAIATVTTTPTPTTTTTTQQRPKRKSLYAQQKEMHIQMNVPTRIITHGRRASMEGATVVPIGFKDTISPTSTRLARNHEATSQRPNVDTSLLVRDIPSVVTPSNVSFSISPSASFAPNESSSQHNTPRVGVTPIPDKKSKPIKSTNAW